MMQGYVNSNYEAVLCVVVGYGALLKPVNAIIDTGFTGFLSLPISIIAELKLPWSYRARGTLGDGSETLFDLYNARVIWDGQYREIEINAAETDPLVGMSLLRGFRLQIDAVPRGGVNISALPNVI